jgi:HTH-type transcriptional repressor of NAD biosynthesis genes
MPNYRHAVVAMKAWPFHRGHNALIEHALDAAEHVSILVIGSIGEEPDYRIRAGWIVETFKDRNVHVYPCANIYTDDMSSDPATAEEASRFWAVYTKQILANDLPDVVVSSEEYGIRWAKHMGIAHIMHDANRTFYMTSGTEIRRDPFLHWDMIMEKARPHYLRKVAIVGAESSGKTTLSKNLARRYGTQFAPEYGRIYDEQTRGKNEEVNKYHERIIFADILNVQPMLNREAEENARHVVFYDTDLLTTSIWFENWQGTEDKLHEHIVSDALDEEHDLVLIQDLAPFIDDGLRGHKHEREAFLKNLEQLERTFNDNVVKLTGSWQERESKAIREVNKLFKNSKATFPQP